ncbi:rCG32857 [Rattus norvegicus]|uniref:RCG32857 n=1 Tax=Rattus norvegicus TaxID=10116 RepID=A6HE09_RAT|nr:rCG32857 [Rattus norvegicus]
MQLSARHIPLIPALRRQR